ncbi:carbon-nitrogen hydrolase [Abortiporus biennis]|nr:carbon-nitrogen hydrolase [Abortiporus biennis]
MSGKIRASVVQTCSASYSLPETLKKLEHYARIAVERDGAQFVVFPEGFVGGYPMYSNFGISGLVISPEGRDEFVRYHAAAIEVPSPATAEIERISKELNAFFVVGVIERDLGSLYCTAIFIDPVQGYIAKHRKIMPSVAERLVWAQGGASTLPVIDATFHPRDGHDSAGAVSQAEVKAKVSCTICWENYMPLLRTFYYSKGTQLYCAPTIDSTEEWQHAMHLIALEGRCFVLCACQYAEEKDYPEGHAVADDNKRSPNNIMIAGGSVIISPLGKVLAGPLRGEEGVLSAELDLDDVARGKFDRDVVGHYSRPDIFNMQVTGA